MLSSNKKGLLPDEQKAFTPGLSSLMPGAGTTSSYTVRAQERSPEYVTSLAPLRANLTWS